MLSTQHKAIAQEAIDIFTSYGAFSVQSINEGSCGEFADYLIGEYARAGLPPHQILSTFDFITSDPDYSGDCEYLREWQETEMVRLGVTKDYFEQYKKQVAESDERAVVGYHVWLFDGDHHYDAECLEGVKNPLELPFFQLFTKKEKRGKKMKCLVTIDYNDGSIEERKHEGANLQEVMANFLSFNKNMDFEKDDKITFRIIQD